MLVITPPGPSTFPPLSSLLLPHENHAATTTPISINHASSFSIHTLEAPDIMPLPYRTALDLLSLWMLKRWRSSRRNVPFCVPSLLFFSDDGYLGDYSSVPRSCQLSEHPPPQSQLRRSRWPRLLFTRHICSLRDPSHGRLPVVIKHSASRSLSAFLRSAEKGFQDSRPDVPFAAVFSFRCPSNADFVAHPLHHTLGEEDERRKRSEGRETGQAEEANAEKTSQ